MANRGCPQKCPYKLKFKGLLEKYHYLPLELFEELFYQTPYFDPNRHREEFEVKSQLEAIESAKKTLQYYLPKSEKTQNIFQAFHELLINAIEHGNKLDPAKKVKVRLTLLGEFIIIAIEDEGEGFDWVKILSRNQALTSVNQQGRNLGITLLNHMPDEIFYNYPGNKAILFTSLNPEEINPDIGLDTNPDTDSDTDPDTDSDRNFDDKLGS